MVVSVVGKPVFFRNGWPCSKCGCVTEHREVKGRQVCLDCGSRLGKTPEAKQRERRRYKHLVNFGIDPDVKAEAS